MLKYLLLLCAVLVSLTNTSISAPKIVLAKDGISAYTLVVSPNASSEERKAAKILQNYFERVTGAGIRIESPAHRPDFPYICVGNTPWHRHNENDQAYTISAHKGNLFISGGSHKGIIYGVYTFIEQILGCRKWAPSEPAICPGRNPLTVDGKLHIHARPALTYREAYFPAEDDPEYLDWHKLQRLDDLWGIWGHSFDKLVPAQRYFNAHPEYFSFYNGERCPLQLCLTNKEVLKIAIEAVRKSIRENPGARYWSITPNDDTGACECKKCSQINQYEGGPQGTLIRFVNAIAKEFPDKIFTTLAYGYASQPPLHTKPRSNVYIFLSSIDAYRTHPLKTEKSAAAFRRNLAGWEKLTPHVFVWDYDTQFTNFLAPFPVIPTFQDNITYFLHHQVSGLFAQGSGYDYSNLAELKQYLLAQLMWNPNQDVTRLTDQFLKGYYGAAGKYVGHYIEMQYQALQKSGMDLDIYGNPVEACHTFLTPELMDQYSSVLDSAEREVDTDPVLWKRINRLRLSDEFAFLQQTRFYGIDRYGIWNQTNGTLALKPRMKKRVELFCETCRRNDIKVLNEEGKTIEQYQQEWDSCFRHPPEKNLATKGSVVKLTYPYVKAYATKGPRTLIDGMYGFDDFSYNWLCFYGVPLECVIDLGSAKEVKKIALNFLEDQRHWIFRPKSLDIEGSLDGKTFFELGHVTPSKMQENYTIRKIPMAVSLKNETLRYIRVRADVPDQLPPWRWRQNKKSTIACDEIWVTD